MSWRGKVEIQRVKDGGYFVEGVYDDPHVDQTLEEVFQNLLRHFEGRWLKQDRVIIEREDEPTKQGG